MSAFGFHCRITNDLPVLVGVELTGDPTNPHLGRVLRYRAAAHEPLAQQLRGLIDAVETTIRRESPAAVVVRLPDRSPRGPRAEDVTLMHGLVAGAILAIAHRFSPHVHGLRGVDIGRACGTDKETALAEARALTGSGVLAEAAAAALAGLHIEAGP